MNLIPFIRSQGSGRSRLRKQQLLFRIDSNGDVLPHSRW